MDIWTVLLVIAAVAAWGYFSWVVGFKMAMFGMTKFYKFYPFKKIYNNIPEHVNKV